ncbi:hypothetical protein [Haloferax elongans]|nr:hypothetical protein [Haloferax elongans]
MVIGGIPLYMRYVRWSKSIIELDEMQTLEGSTSWHMVTNDGMDFFSRRIMMKASNKGLRSGVVTDISLIEIKTQDETIKCREKGLVHEVVMERYNRDGIEKRFEFENEKRQFQIISGKDDEILSAIPFLRRSYKSEVSKIKESDICEFVFELQIEDNKRVYYSPISIDVGTSELDNK